MSVQRIPVFAISLARARDRRIAIERHLRGLGVEFECVDGVDGKLLTPEDLEKVSDAPDLPVGQIACCLSHFSVYERIVTRGIPVACVLEDDGRLLHSAVRLLERGCAGGPAFDVCFLDSADENHKGVVCFDRDSAQALAPGVIAYELSDAPACLHAYLISFAGAEKRLAHAFPIREPIDRYESIPVELHFRAVVLPRAAFLSTLSRTSLALDLPARSVLSLRSLRGLPGFYPLRDLVRGHGRRRRREMRAKQVAGELSRARRWRPLFGGCRILPE